MRPPRAVVPGDRIAVVAPASPFPSDRHARGIEVLRGLGFSTVEHPFARASTGYLAGPDGMRLQQLEDALADPGVAAVWAARGGYGLTRIAAQLAPALAKADKVIVGFSDVCAVHAVAQRAGLISLHGPVITQLGDLGPRDLEALVGALAGKPAEVRGEGPVLSRGRAEGRLAGGCLSVLAAMVGTPIFPDLRGAIVILEDVGEATYRLDRMLTQMLQAGAFEGARAIACGDFLGCEPRKPTEPVAIEVLAERLGGLGVPVLGGFPFGHGKRNFPLPLGARAELDADAGVLRVLGP